jgi:hypothetical protein
MTPHEFNLHVRGYRRHLSALQAIAEYNAAVVHMAWGGKKPQRPFPEE